MSDEEFSSWIDAFDSARLFKIEKFIEFCLGSSEIYLPEAYSCIKADQLMEWGHDRVVLERSPFLEYPLMLNDSKPDLFSQFQSIDIDTQVLFENCKPLPIMHVECPEKATRHCFSFNQPAQIEGNLSILDLPIRSDLFKCNQYLNNEAMHSEFPHKFEKLEFESKDPIKSSLKPLEFPCCSVIKGLQDSKLIEYSYRLDQDIEWRFKVQHIDYSCLMSHENIVLPLVKNTLVTNIRPLWIQYFKEFELSLENDELIIPKEQKEWTWPLKGFVNQSEKDIVLNVGASSEAPSTKSRISTSNPLNFQGKRIVLNYGMLNEHQIIASFQQHGLGLIERDFGTPKCRMFAVSDQDLFILYNNEMDIDELHLRQLKSKYSRTILLINIENHQFGKAAILNLWRISFTFKLETKYYQGLRELLEIIARAMSTDQTGHFEEDESMHERLLVRALPHMNPHKAQKLLRKYSLRDILTREHQQT